MKTIRNIIILSALLVAVWACQEKVNPYNTDSGYGSIVLTLGSNDGLVLKTKTDPTPAEELADGLRFQNLLVLLVDNTGHVVNKYYKDDYADSGPMFDIIHFTGLLPSNYTAYAYANIDKTVWQSNTSSEQISYKEHEAANGADFNTLFLNRQLKEMTGSSEAPGTPATAMLLTGKKAIAVGLSTVNETMELRRPVVRFKVTVSNNTIYPVRIDNLSFSHFNPDKAYLIEHTDGNGLPVVPDGTTYQSLPAYNSASPQQVAARGETCVYSTYLYEGASTNPYKIFADMTLIRSANPSDNLEVSIGGRDFGPIDINTLNAMDEGESVNILLVNPQVNVRSGRLFCHISTDNYIAWESTGYANYDRLFGRVQAIYKQDHGVDAYTYNEYNGSTANGYSSWDGLTASSGSTTNIFEYSGARTNSNFFRRLSKSNGKFTIEGLAVNPATESNISNLTVEEGRRNGNSKITSNTDQYLVKFLNASGQALTSDVNFNSTDDNTKRITFFKFDQNSYNQDRQFILFGKYCTGGKLNRILSESHK